ncbi:helix-turn-helix transcriptional regulator [Phenylobacterium sp.]|uniref:helix-turn-helix domain-containing protein n=1 Tax=Phenylobacterium sp. TaxID=1871053 RepID=UPI00289ADE9C|nr:helix-turn-helix transcriptional regulator [Phenylobacterium sp.]
MARSVFTDAYALMISVLTRLRKEQAVSQAELARRLGRTQQFISYVENCERRIDVVEFYAIVMALNADPKAVFAEVVDALPDKVEI